MSKYTYPEYGRRYYQAHKSEIRANQRKHILKKKYDLTVEDYELGCEMQGGLCAICKQLPERGLVVDHDHVTGELRGLLCHACNLVLGNARDQPETLFECVLYLKGNDMPSFSDAVRAYKAKKDPSAPNLNPPEAEKVLEQQTTPEVEAPKAAPSAPVAASASPPAGAPAAQESPKRTRRTAAQIAADRAAEAAASGTTAPATEPVTAAPPVTGDRSTYQLPSVTFEAPGAVLNLLDKRAISNAIWDSGLTSGTITIKVGL